MTIVSSTVLNPVCSPEPKPPSCVLEVSRATISYVTERGPKVVLDNLSQEFQGGKICVIMGRNGCGKSTLLKAIVGELPLISGQIQFNCDGGQCKQVMEYLPQDYRQAVFPWKSVRANVYPWDNLKHAGDFALQLPSLIEDVLLEFALATVAERYPYKISGGQQQLLLLARSVISQSNVVVLDEPFSAIDIVRRAAIAERLRKDWRGKGKVVICAMHEPDEAVTLADEVLFCSGTPMRIAERIERRESESPETFRNRIMNAIHSVADEGGYNA